MRTVVILGLLFLSLSLNAQTDSIKVSHKNNVYVSGSYAFIMLQGSVNYERQLMDLNKGKGYVRLGLGRYVEWGDDGNLLYTNWMYLFGKKKNFFELDMGLLTRISSIDPSMSMYSTKAFAKYEFWPLVNVGYRYQNPKKHFMLRTGIGTEYIYFGIGFSF